MSTVQISTHPQRNRCVATVTDDNGERFGSVVMRGIKFTATRRHGSSADIRRYGEGFHTIEAAVRWIVAGVTA